MTVSDQLLLETDQLNFLETEMETEESEASLAVSPEEIKDVLKSYFARMGKSKGIANQSILFEKFKEHNDLVARNEIVSSNIGLALKIANSINHYGVPSEIIKSSAIELLFKAAQKFDPLRGVVFSTYATHYIRHELKGVICDYHEIPRTVSKRSMFLTMAAVIRNIRAQDPEISSESMMHKLCQHYKTLPENVRYIETKLANISSPSIYAHVGREGQTKLIDLVPSNSQSPEEICEESDASNQRTAFLHAVMGTMTQMDRELVEAMHLGDEHVSIKDAAETAGLTPHAALNLHRGIMRKFKQAAGQLETIAKDYRLPPTPERYLPTELHKTVDNTAKKLLNPADFALFSLAFFQREDRPKIAFEDFAEALNISRHEAEKRLKDASQKVLQKLDKSTEEFFSGILDQQKPLPRSEIYKIAESALRYIHLNGEIPDENSAGDTAQDWKQNSLKIRQNLGITIPELVAAWSRDMVKDYSKKYHIPYHLDKPVPVGYFIDENKHGITFKQLRNALMEHCQDYNNDSAPMRKSAPAP